MLTANFCLNRKYEMYYAQHNILMILCHVTMVYKCIDVQVQFVCRQKSYGCSFEGDVFLFIEERGTGDKSPTHRLMILIQIGTFSS